MSEENGQTGGPGHFVSAFPFLLLGVFFLLQCWSRVRALKPGESFCEKHVPEKDMRFLWKMGSFVFGFCLFGVLFEGVIVPHAPPFFLAYDHEILYLTYGAAGAVAMLESTGRLPPDATRAMLGLSSLLAWVQWSAHADMKPMSNDRMIHQLLADTCLAHAAVFAFSVYNPQNMTAYVTAWALLVLQGTWMVAMGVNATFHTIEMDEVVPLFVAEVLVILAIILAFVSRRVTPAENSKLSAREVSQIDGDEECEELFRAL